VRYFKGVKTCWAASLQDCSAKLSREHLVSEGLFESTQVRVGGFPWCKGEERIVGLSSFVRKILCTHHNSEMSPVDQEACTLFDEVRKATKLQDTRVRLKPRHWNVRQVEFEGLLLERWFLKTTINLCLAGRTDLRWAPSDTPLTEPPPLMVQAAFAKALLPEFMGLYTVRSVGSMFYSDDTVSFAPLIQQGTHVAGGIFGFRGFQFLLSLVEERAPERLDFIRFPNWENASPAYHLRHIRFEVAGFLSQRFTFRWQSAA
jgi:hypothetical protein